MPLTPGEHTVSGNFLWDELPESLQVPPSTALLSLNLRGAAVPFPVVMPKATCGCSDSPAPKKKTSST